MLLTDAGLLARYDRLDLVSRWRDALHAGGLALQALWLLVPLEGTSDLPMLNGRAVPVLGREGYARIPVDWLRRAHRVPHRQR